MLPRLTGFPCLTLCPSAASAASKPASMRGLCKYAIQLFTGVRLPHPEKIISILGRSNLVWVSEWISLRVKTSTSVLSMYPQNGRGKRCVLIQLLDGTTVSPPDSVFASGPILLHPGYSYVFLRPVRVTCTTAMFHCPSSSVDDRQRSFSSRPIFLTFCPLDDRPCSMP